MEIKYSAFDRELLGIYLAIKHFKYFVEGREFTVFTDHKQLTGPTGAISSKTERSPRQTSRHIDFIAQFTNDIKHISGKSNSVADYLSRNIGENSQIDINTEVKVLIDLQENDTDLNDLLSNNDQTKSTYKLQPMQLTDI